MFMAEGNRTQLITRKIFKTFINNLKTARKFSLQFRPLSDPINKQTLGLVTPVINKSMKCMKTFACSLPAHNRESNNIYIHRPIDTSMRKYSREYKQSSIYKYIDTWGQSIYTKIYKIICYICLCFIAANTRNVSNQNSLYIVRTTPPPLYNLRPH